MVEAGGIEPPSENVRTWTYYMLSAVVSTWARSCPGHGHPGQGGHPAIASTSPGRASPGRLVRQIVAPLEAPDDLQRNVADYAARAYCSLAVVWFPFAHGVRAPGMQSMPSSFPSNPFRPQKVKEPPLARPAQPTALQ